MRNGKCVKCGSDDIYKSVNGIISGDKNVYVRNISLMTPRSDRMTFLCTACGYYENYILDEEVLAKVREKWNRV